MRTATEEWLASAQDDLDTIAEIIENRRLTSMVAFHAQQCVEKCLKATLEENEQEVPSIHNLVTLNGRTAELLPEAIDEDLLDRLNQLYIEARYPGGQGFFPEGKPSIEEAETFFRFARRVMRLVRKTVQSSA